MHEDTVKVGDAFAVASGALPGAACGAVALEKEAVQQAAQLASWEDEGGTISG